MIINHHFNGERKVCDHGHHLSWIPRPILGQEWSTRSFSDVVHFFAFSKLSIQNILSFKIGKTYYFIYGVITCTCV